MKGLRMTMEEAYNTRCFKEDTYVVTDRVLQKPAYWWWYRTADKWSLQPLRVAEYCMYSINCRELWDNFNSIDIKKSSYTYLYNICLSIVAAVTTRACKVNGEYTECCVKRLGSKPVYTATGSVKCFLTFQLMWFTPYEAQTQKDKASIFPNSLASVGSPESFKSYRKCSKSTKFHQSQLRAKLLNDHHAYRIAKTSNSKLN